MSRTSEYISIKDFYKKKSERKHSQIREQTFQTSSSVNLYKNVFTFSWLFETTAVYTAAQIFVLWNTIPSKVIPWYLWMKEENESSYVQHKRTECKLCSFKVKLNWVSSIKHLDLFSLMNNKHSQGSRVINLILYK